MSGWKVHSKILDVSKWNAGIRLKDFAQVGYNGVIIRAGYGAGHKDPCADRFYREALSLGWDIGFYWFSYAKNPQEAWLEAKYLLEYVKDKTVTLPLVYDFEYSSLMQRPENKVQINYMCRRFLSTIEDNNYYSMFYSNKDWYFRVWDGETKRKYDCWYARYGSVPKALKDIPNVHLIQSGNTCKIGEKVYNQDVNRDLLGLAKLIKERGLAHYGAD